MGMAAIIIVVPHFLVPSLQQDPQDPLAVDIVLVLALAAMATTGAIVGSRNRGNPIGWLLLVMPLAAAGASFSNDIYAQYTVHIRPVALPGGVPAVLVGNALWFVFLGQLVFLTLLFPDGTLLSARWRWVSWGLFGTLVALFASLSLGPELEILGLQGPPISNPITVAGAEGILNTVETTAWVAIALLLIAAIVSLVLRFIRSTGEERQQIKWFVYTAGVFGTYMAISVLGEATGNTLPEDWDTVLFAGFFLLLPAGIAVAILKYRLYDIDVLINRTLVYGTLTAVLAGTYFGSVILLQMAFRNVTGQESTVALVASTLAIAALFQPMRRVVQRIIDSRFYRRRYDAARTLAVFGATARDEVELPRLSSALVGVVQQTMQPAHVSLWLREGNSTTRGRVEVVP